MQGLDVAGAEHVRVHVHRQQSVLKERNTVERLINKLKAWRGIATRYEGKTRREAIRCLKRYVAREIYQTIIPPRKSAVTPVPAG